MKSRVTAVVCAFVGGFAVWAQDGLVAHFSCDEGEGSVLQDRSGNGHDGTIVGGATWAAGAWGTALRLDGEDDYVDCGTAVAPALADTGTLALWFKPLRRCQGGVVAWT